MTVKCTRTAAANLVRACLSAMVFVFVAIAGLLPSGPAQAQTVGLSKTLCTTLPAPGDAAACTATSAQAFVPVYYKIVVNNSAGTAGTVSLTESYPSNFHFVGVTCTATNGASVGSSTGTSGTPISVSMATGQTAVCIVEGYFTQAGAANNVVSSGSATATRNSTVPAPTSLPTDLSIVKTASVTQVDISGAPATIVYTVTITNNGGTDVYLGQLLTIRDSLSLYSNGVPLNVSYVPGSTSCSSGGGANCVSSTPTFTGTPPLSGAFTPFLEWKFPTGSTGYVPVGGTITLTYEVKVERNPLIYCIRQPGSDGLQNKAELILDPPGPMTSLVDINTANNVSMAPGVNAITGITAVDPQCGVWGPANPIKITKVQTLANPTGGFAWGTSVPYSITIKNMTNQVLTGVQISDFVMSIPGSPVFVAQQMGSPMVGMSCLSAVTSNFAGAGAQSVNTYYTPTQVGVATVTLQPNQTCTFTAYSIRYQAPGCDAFTNSNNPIRNTARATWTGTWSNPPNGAPPVSGTFVATDSNDVNGVLVDTLMAAGPACDLRVSKMPAGGALGNIKFGVWSGYVVSFRNNNNFQVSVGTLIDAIRLVQPNYAASLSVAYQYNCPPVAGISNAPTSGTGTTNVVYTQYPHQGARIINGGAGSGPVVFGALKTLNCTVKINVSPPPPGAAYCLSAVQPELENTALMMSPAGYSANGPWSPTGTYDATFPYPSWQPYPIPAPWGTVVKPLPKCFSLQVNKDATPTVTWTTSSTPETYTITVQNLGDAFIATGTVLGNWTGPVLKDTFTTGTPSPPTFVSLVPANCCVWLTAPPAPAVGQAIGSPTFLLGIKSLAALGQPGDSLTLTFKVNPGPYVQPKIANEAVVFRPNANGTWYSNDPSGCYPPGGPPYTTLPPPNYFQSVVGSCARVEVPVLGVGKVKIVKVVNNATGAPTPGMFDMTLSCAFNGQALTPSQHFVAPGSTGIIRNNLPATSVCSVTEAPLPYVPVAPNCSNGASWSTVIAGQPATVVANATQTITVTNTLTCTPPGPGLTINKVIIHPTQGNLLMGSPPVFPVNVTCTDGFNANVNIVGAGSQVVTGPTVGTSCTVTETLPTSPFQGNCPILMNWMAPTTTPGPTVTMGSTGATVTLTNRYYCFTTFGNLTVTKTVLDIVMSSTSTPFNVQVSCAWPNMAPSFLQTVQLGGSLLLSRTIQIPVGMTCTVVETPPPPMSGWIPPCRWLTTYPGSTTPNLQHGFTIAAGNRTVVISNEQTCSTTSAPGDAQLRVMKEVTVNGALQGSPTLSPLTFNMTLTCTGQTVQNITLTTNALGRAETSLSLPAGTICTLNEPVQGPPPTMPPGCNWSGKTYRWNDSALNGAAGSTVTLSQQQRQYQLIVRNNVTCPPPAPPPGGGGGGSGDRRGKTIEPPPLTPPPPPRDDRPPTVSDGSKPVDSVLISIGRVDGGAMTDLRTDGEGRAPGTRLPPGVYRVTLDPVSLMKGLTGMPGVKVTSGRPPISIGVGVGGSSGGGGGSRDGPDRGRGGSSGGGGGVSIGIPLGGGAPRMAAVPGAAVVVVVTVGGQSTETRLPCCEKRGFDSAPPIYATVPPGAGPISISVRYAPPPKKR